MRLLITGGAGRIGRVLRRELAGVYPLIRTLDRLPLEEVGPDEESIVGDIADLATVEAAMDGIDGVIHLAGVPREADFATMLPTNIVGTWNIYDAARRAGARRIVFGSSNHAVGFYPTTTRVDSAMPIRPDTRYGLTKCWGEAIGHLHADKYGLKSLHIRIGSVTPLPANARSLALWISGRDLAQLCRIGLEHPDIHSDIVYGISDNARGWYDNSVAFRLGYRPLDRAEDHIAHAMAGEAALSHTPEALYFQGGLFVATEYAGGPVPPPDREPS